ncbi:MAG TPA: hypothetical protein PLF81_31385, partial [Candidatus Anammoximicrobium sp.]|nr:hypothetical protein [Candidatus Anammoximicrobium sp.]
MSTRRVRSRSGSPAGGPSEIRANRRQNRPQRRRLVLEFLEDRRLLATFQWTGGGLDDLWANGANWDQSGSTPGATDDVLFLNAGAGDVDLGGGPQTVQSVSFQNTAGNDFQLSNGRLTVTGLAQTGTGSNTIAVQLAAATFTGTISAGSLELANLSNSLTGTWNVAGGTLAAQGGTVGDGLGGADVTLNGGTLELRSSETSQLSALAHYGYHVNNDGAVLDLNNNGGMVNGNPPNPTAFTNFSGAALLTDGPGGRGLDFNDDNDFINTGAIGQVDNYSNLWLGTLHV